MRLVSQGGRRDPEIEISWVTFTQVLQGTARHTRPGQKSQTPNQHLYTYSILERASR